MQRIFAAIILAGSALAFSGCRSDVISHDPPANDNLVAIQTAKTLDAPAARPVNDHRPLLVCFGDSLTAGLGADEGQTYPDFLQRDLDRDGYHYRVVNEGVSGDTTKDGVDRLADVVALKPAVVVLEFGGNDGLRGFKVDTTRGNLATMITALKGAGAKVVLAGMTLPPDYGPDYVNAFTANYPMLGRKYDLPVLPFLLQGAYGVDGMIQRDGIHATDKGNEVVANNVLPLVERLLRK